MLGDGGASSFGLRLRTGERCSRRGRSVGYRQTWGGMLRAPLPTLTCLWSLRLPLTLPSPAVVAPSPLPPLFQPLRTLVALQGPEPQREPTPPPSPSVFQPTGRCFPLTSRGLELVLMHRHCSSPCQTGLRPQPAIWGRPGGRLGGGGVGAITVCHIESSVLWIFLMAAFFTPSIQWMSGCMQRV